MKTHNMRKATNVMALVALVLLSSVVVTTLFYLQKTL
jgi:hypothetical protein